MQRARQLVPTVVIVALLVSPATLAQATPVATGAFAGTWARTDRPVLEGTAHRTWMWGPGPFTGAMGEPYAEAPGGVRLVQYFDKTRMELTDPAADPRSPWDVTNGLLAKELVTGQLQLGQDTLEPHPPAAMNIAGDADDPDGPTYASFSTLLGTAPLPVGQVITLTLDRAGVVGEDPELAAYGVTAASFVPETNHTVASVFWEFMNSTGLVHANGQHVEARLFENAFDATGFPLAESY